MPYTEAKESRMKETNQWLAYTGGVEEMFDEIEARLSRP